MEDHDSLWFGHGIVPDFLVGYAPPLTSKLTLTIDTSHSRPTSHEQISTNSSPQIFSTRQSRERSRIILLPGSKIISKLRTVPLRVRRPLMRLIRGLPRFQINFSIIPQLLSRITLVPLFPGLRRFKQGQNFQQWTGNDSKAFMKVSLLKHDQAKCAELK